jgi:hypothetical protein
MWPAHGWSINVLEADLTGSGRQRWDDEGFAGFGPSGQNPDVRMLKALMVQPPLGVGQLHVAARDQYGRRRVCAAPLSYLDVPEGRWMTQVTTNGSGQNWVIAAPGAPQLLATKLNEMQSVSRATV